MATLRINQSVAVKTKLSHTLRNWLPILHAGLDTLNDALQPFVEANPVLNIESGFEGNFTNKFPKKIFSSSVANSRTEKIEALTVSKRSLYDVLDEQLEAPLFPTPISQRIARYIVENLDENGYYEGKSEQFCIENGITCEAFERIRKRFVHVEPVGIGAKDIKECFLFQLDNADIGDEAYTLAEKLIENLDSMHSFSDEKYFDMALKTISSFKNPPAIEYMEDSTQIVPDLMIFFEEEGGIEVKLNDSYYPTINIDAEYGVKHDFIAQKIKEARNLVDALEMRKATLYKVGLMIVEYQYDFFVGGDIKPLTLKTLADEFGHNPSTISRAIANKYIACERGIFSMKEFFTTAIDEDVSNTTIKEYLLQIVKEESPTKPLSDMKILEMIQEKFQVTMVRRTVAKYRKQLNIAGSSERKKLYRLTLS
jgi:RNA polymerase sigma-54 factor